VSDAGLMKMAAAERFIYKTLETLRFYKEDGKYFFTVTLPEVPTGYEMWLRMDMDPGIGFSTGALLPERDIPKSGLITKELPSDYMARVLSGGDIQTLIGVSTAETQPLTTHMEGHANILSIYKGGKLEEFYTKTDPYNGTGKDMALTYSDYFDF
jgi:hypothetical protein